MIAADDDLDDGHGDDDDVSDNLYEYNAQVLKFGKPVLGLQLSKIKKGKDGDQSDRRLLVIARLIILIKMLMMIILSLT